MNYKPTPKITNKQKEILSLIYSHRYLTRIHIQKLLKHKDKKTINIWLKDLRAKDYIKWIYDKNDFINKTKPAVYYLGINGIRHLGNEDIHPDEELRKRYREHTRSQTYIDHRLLIADCVVDLENARSEELSYYYETQADYMSDSYYHFLSESELIRPDLCIAKMEYKPGEAETAISYILGVFDPTFPRYRLRNRLKKYVQFIDEEVSEWEEAVEEPFPTVLFVCATLTDLIYAKRRTRGLLADVWGYEDEDRPSIMFATVDKLKQYGFTAGIWEEA